MRPKHIPYIIAAADADGICTAQTLAAAGDLTIDGALASGGVASLTIPRHVSITAAGDESGVIFTVTGTDRYGTAQRENITGINTATVATTKNFRTVTSISTDGALAGNVTAGSADSLETGWIPLDKHGIVDCGYTISSGGAMNVDVQTTIGDVFGTNEQLLPIDGALGGTAIGMQTATAVRLKITGHVSGNVTFDVINKRI